MATTPSAARVPTELNERTAAITRRMAASPQEVWSVLANGWLYPSWVVGAARMRNVDDQWPAPGAQLHHSVGGWPLLLDDSTEVLACEPERLLLLRARAWPAGAAQVLIELVEGPDGTRVSIREDAVAGPALLMPRRARQAAIAPRNREALRRLSFLAEGG